MTPREIEIVRIIEIAQHVFDDDRMLFGILSGDDPKDVRANNYEKFSNAGNQVPNTFVSAAQALYKMVGTEFDNRLIAQRICYVIQKYFVRLMPFSEFQAFVKSIPLKFPIKYYGDLAEWGQDRVANLPLLRGSEPSPKPISKFATEEST